MLHPDISWFKRRTIYNVSVADDRSEIVFTFLFGEKVRMYHYQDCCERVYLEDVCGDWADLIGYPLLKTE